jgi:branched-subunit amino acid ABC-type transport system permease component
MAEFLQCLFSGVTVGAVYALVALGFTLIYNASDVVNFAQGEFVMLGGMITFFSWRAGVPLPLAAVLAILAAATVGVLLNKLAIEPARGAPVVSLIVITIGASIFLRGSAQLVFDKQLHRFPTFPETIRSASSARRFCRRASGSSPGRSRSSYCCNCSSPAPSPARPYSRPPIVASPPASSASIRTL